MNCMKCGRETENDNVFCPDCLLIMEKHPVRPGAVVFLPRRRESTMNKKASKRHVPNHEEQIKQLRKRMTILSVLLAICIAIIAIMLKPALHYLMDEHVAIGQNYSSVIPIASESQPLIVE